MKKKILISTHTLNIGGVERSFTCLLQNIDLTKYEVDVFVYQHGGELFDQLPPHVNVLPEMEDYALLLEPIQNSLKKKKWGIAYAKVVSRIREKVFFLTNKTDSSKTNSIIHLYLCREALPFMPAISEKQYDAVLAFLHPNYFERSKANAATYVSWIHCDYSNLNIDKAAELAMWKQFDYIAGVSEDTLHSFEKIFPSLKQKLLVIENLLSSTLVINQSTENNVTDDMPRIKGEFIFLSIGRFTTEKNFDSIPEIAIELRKLGLLFKWYLIGYGSGGDIIRRNIKNFDVEKEVIVLGKKKNPYPYITACDFYIQPSRSEGKAVTVREAQILRKPVIITNFPSAQSQVLNGVDGVILPLDNRKFAEGVYKTVFDEKLVDLLKYNMNKTDYTNFKEVQKIYRLINKKKYDTDANEYKSGPLQV